MNPLVTRLLEKTLEVAAHSIRDRHTPNPFRRFREDGLWWLEADPDDFYAVPSTPPRLQFDTIFAGLNRVRSRFTYRSFDRSPYPVNNTVHGLATLSRRQKPRGAMIMVHGHTMKSFSLLEWFAVPAARLGLDVYYITLPYHMQRAPAGTWSGQYHLNSDVQGTALAFRQGVLDVRALVSWIEQEKGVPVILAGVSLGAFTCSMTTVVDARPSALISIIGGGSLAQIHWDGYQMNRPRRQLMSGGVSGAKLERYWAMLGPANWKSKLEREKMLLIAGKYDPIVTPSNVRRLWNAWDQPELRWVPAGHSTIMFHNLRVVRDIIQFLENRVL